MSRFSTSLTAATTAACIQWMPTGFLSRDLSCRLIETKSPLSSIWAVAWANRDSSRSSGGMAIRPGRPARKAMKAATSGPRQPCARLSRRDSSVMGG